MAAPTTTVTLTGPNAPTSVTITATAPGTQAPVNVPGVVHRTQGGSLVSYQVGPAYWTVTLQINSLTNAQKNTLESFVRANWGQSLTYTDENGNAFTAKLLDSGLPSLKKDARDSWSCTIGLNLSGVLL